MAKQTFNPITYHSNTEPQIGDHVRSARDIDEEIDELFVVTDVGLGRLGNKICVKPINADPHGYGREYYYYCFCPQAKETVATT